MSIIPHHTSEPVCPLCEVKLATAHPFMQDWFHRVKAKYINVHVAWAYRGPEDQQRAYQDHKSNAQFPNSPHNRMDQNKRPESLALDLFLISEDGVANFPPPFYTKLAQEVRDAKEPIKWGGEFHFLGDKDHFQYIPS